MRTVCLVIILFFTQFTMTITANPLLKTNNNPHQAIPFDKIKNADYEPAFVAAMKSHNAEIKRKSRRL